MSMPFYVSPEQSMRDKADYARKGVARSRSSVVVQYSGGILMVTPNLSSVLHKISEIYDRIAFAAVGRYNEYEVLRKAGVTYADLTGYQFDRGDVTARGLANWYAQALGQNFSEPTGKPYEVEIVVAEVGAKPDSDQIYRISWDGSVSDEPGFVAFGGQADQVAAALKEHFSDGMSLTEALGAALAALAAPAAATGAAGRGERRAARADGSQPGGCHPRPGPRAPHLPPPARPAPRGAHRGVPHARRDGDARDGDARDGDARGETPAETAAPKTTDKPAAPSSDEPPTGPTSPGDGSPML